MPANESDYRSAPAPPTRPVPDEGSSAATPLASRIRVRRIKATVMAAAAIGVLGLARYAEPDADGTGTHTRLGLAPCGFLLTTGMPCPSCGMTTAYAELMHGRILRGFLVQPAGAVLCLATIFLAMLGTVVVWTGRGVAIPWYRIQPRWILIVGLGLLLGSWAYKMAVIAGRR